MNQPTQIEDEVYQLVPRPEIYAQYLKVCLGLVPTLREKEVERRFALGRQIQQQYPDYRNYQYYHWLVGGSAHPTEHPIGEDFPGDLSVQKYFQDRIERYSQRSL